jgi:L-rhamnose mutarotase
MSLLDKMRERDEQRKKEQAHREGKPYLTPTWPEGFPKLSAINPKPQEGFIEERIIYRLIKSKKENQFRNRTFYISQNEIYFRFETKDTLHEWNVISFDEYKQEYEKVYEYIRKTGKLTGRNKFSELTLLDEIVTTVPIKLIMNLKPSPEEVDQLKAANDELLENRYLSPTQDELDLPDNID